jgi:hypothetical protein
MAARTRTESTLLYGAPTNLACAYVLLGVRGGRGRTHEEPAASVSLIEETGDSVKLKA